MHIGIDFDNTIVCYDELFHREAVARKLISTDVAQTKNAVRDFLRETGREDDWTALQGFVYGDGIDGARPFPGVKQFLTEMQKRGSRVSVISHKTQYPVIGPRTNLHEAARRWLEDHEFLERDRFGLSNHRVFFNETKEAKLMRISELGCTHFVDDLPEFLSEPSFPAGVARILFDPHRSDAEVFDVVRASSWLEILELLT